MPLPILQDASSVSTAPVKPTPGSRRVYLHTFGCQMNEHDTLRMTERLAERGFGVTDSADEADLVVVNTCSVRELAVQKALSEVGRLKALKKGRGTKIAVTCSVAQQEG